MTIVESGWNVWMWLVGVLSKRRVWLVRDMESMGVVVRKYIDFLILLIPTLLYLFFFAVASLLFVHLNKKMFSCSMTFL